MSHFFLIISTIPSVVLNTTQMDTSRGFVPKLTHIQQASVTYSRFTTWGFIHDDTLNQSLATAVPLHLLSHSSAELKLGFYHQNSPTIKRWLFVCIWSQTGGSIPAGDFDPISFTSSLLLFSHLSSGLKVGPTNSTHNTQATESVPEIQLQLVLFNPISYAHCLCPSLATFLHLCWIKSFIFANPAHNWQAADLDMCSFTWCLHLASTS